MIRGADGRLFVLLAVNLFLLPLLYTPFTHDVFGIGKATLVRIIGGILLLLAATDALRGRFRLAPNSMLYLVVSFFGLVMLAGLTSVHVPTSIFGLRHRFFGIISYLPILIIFLSAAKIRWTPERLLLMFQAFTLSAVLVSVVGLAQVLGAGFPVDLKFKFGKAAYSTFGNPNFVGVFLVMSVPIALTMISEADRKTRIYWLIATAAIIGGIWATLSAGAWVSGVIIMMAYGLLHLSRKAMISGRQLAVIALICAIAVSVFGALILGQEGRHARDRIETWKASLRVMSDFPLTGTGPDTMRFVIQKYKGVVPGVDQEIPEDAHNLFLTIGATTGVPALIIFIALLAVIGRRLLKAQADGPRGRLYHTLLLSIAGYLLAEMINPDSVANLAVFWTLMGVAMALTTEGAPRSQIKFNSLVAVLLIPLAIAMIVLPVPLFMSEYFLKRAERSVNLSEITAAYRTSQTLNPYCDWYQIRVADRFLDELGRDPQASDLVIRAASRAVELSPLEGDNHQILGAAYHNLARVEGDTRRYLQAVSSYEQALELNPYNRAAAGNLLLAYEELGMSTEAATLQAHWTELETKLGL